jgi:hypothetical protein
MFDLNDEGGRTIFWKVIHFPTQMQSGGKCIKVANAIKNARKCLIEAKVPNELIEGILNEGIDDWNDYSYRYFNRFTDTETTVEEFLQKQAEQKEGNQS